MVFTYEMLFVCFRFTFFSNSFLVVIVIIMFGGVGGEGGGVDDAVRIAVR